MNVNRWVWGAVLTIFLFGCAQEPQPSVNPVGLWQGTLTDSSLNKQIFTAKITDSIIEGVYSGVFAVEENVFNVTGYYGGPSIEGDSFTFGDPSEELQPATSPPTPVGTRWYGVMTETEYKGRWEFNSPSENINYLGGDFNLERQP